MAFKIFDSLYLEYDRWYTVNEIIYRNELLCIKEILDHRDRRDGILLDIGVGTGVFSKELPGFKIGVDPAFNPLKIARSRGIEAINAFGEELPFRSLSIDTVLMTVTLCFLEKPEKVLSEVYRVLKNNGYLVSCIVPRDSSWGHYYLQKAREGHRFYKYARFYTNEEHLNLLRNNGFKPVKYCGTLSFNPWDKPFEEKPKPILEGMGFTCIGSLKV